MNENIKFPALGGEAVYKNSFLQSIMQYLCYEGRNYGVIDCDNMECIECGLFYNDPDNPPEDVFYTALLNMLEEKDDDSRA